MFKKYLNNLILLLNYLKYLFLINYDIIKLLGIFFSAIVTKDLIYIQLHKKLIKARKLEEM